MMFSTNVGPVADENSVAYLRPETAQGIFTNYKNIVDSFYPNIPFGIAQIGKAFRNESSPRDFIFRSREFNQMEIEYFVNPTEWKTDFEKIRVLIHEFLEKLELPTEKISELEVGEKDLAHYSERTIDFMYDYPNLGKEELLGLAYRTDFDLMNIQKATKKSMEYIPKNGGERFVPHVIEPSFGVERLVMAVLANAYKTDGDRTYMAFPKSIAPVFAVVSPLLKNKPELVEKARELYRKLHKALNGRVMWDDSGNIGKRYAKADEIGVPYCLVIDFDSLEDNSVTIRHRDTAKQTRVYLDDVLDELGVVQTK
jgi:glycyl-tRNA synthetase